MNPYYFDNEDTAYGFLTRGCIRNCYFCKVPKFEGKIRICDTIENIVGDFKKCVLMDNNLLAYDGSIAAMQYLIDNRIISDLNQGLDFRLTNDENLAVLSKVRQHAPFTFAFDDVGYLNAWNAKIPLIKEYIPSDWCVRLYLYYHPNMKGGLPGLLMRSLWCREHKCLPYLMRDVACWDLPKRERDIS